jgi:hypothetical protein
MLSKIQSIWTINVALHPNFPRNLPCLTPDDFVRQAESAALNGLIFYR